MAPDLTCALCDAKVPGPEFFDHLRARHEEVWAALERWPDGGIVFDVFVDDQT